MEAISRLKKELQAKLEQSEKGEAASATEQAAPLPPKPDEKTERNNEKSAIVTKVSNAVKELLVATAREAALENSSPELQQLASATEAIFRHGLKSKLKIFELKTLTHFWPLVVEFSSKGEIQMIEKKYETVEEREKAWVILAITENSLKTYLRSFSSDRDRTKDFYEEYALVLDEERLEILEKIFISLESVQFQVPTSLEDPADPSSSSVPSNPPPESPASKPTILFGITVPSFSSSSSSAALPPSDLPPSSAPAPNLTSPDPLPALAEPGPSKPTTLFGITVPSFSSSSSSSSSSNPTPTPAPSSSDPAPSKQTTFFGISVPTFGSSTPLTPAPAPAPPPITTEASSTSAQDPPIPSPANSISSSTSEPSLISRLKTRLTSEPSREAEQVTTSSEYSLPVHAQELSQTEAPKVEMESAKKKTKPKKKGTKKVVQLQADNEGPATLGSSADPYSNPLEAAKFDYNSSFTGDDGLKRLDTSDRYESDERLSTDSPKILRRGQQPKTELDEPKAEDGEALQITHQDDPAPGLHRRSSQASSVHERSPNDWSSSDRAHEPSEPERSIPERSFYDPLPEEIVHAKGRKTSHEKATHHEKSPSDQNHGSEVPKQNPKDLDLFDETYPPTFDAKPGPKIVIEERRRDSYGAVLRRHVLGDDSQDGESPVTPQKPLFDSDEFLEAKVVTQRPPKPSIYDLPPNASMSTLKPRTPAQNEAKSDPQKEEAKSMDGLSDDDEFAMVKKESFEEGERGRANSLYSSATQMISTVLPSPVISFASSILPTVKSEEEFEPFDDPDVAPPSNPSESFVLEICPEKGLDREGFVCFECKSQIGVGIFGEARVCDYSGHYYCSQCHMNDTMVIPARVVRNWDFRKYKVCRKSKRLLKTLQAHPIIPLLAENPMLETFLEEVREVVKLRKELSILYKWVSKCTRLSEDAKNKLKKRIWPRGHLVNERALHLYSMQDLAEIETRAIIPFLRYIRDAYRDHVVRTCEVCKYHGAYCDFCRSKTIIYPFDLDSITKCPNCDALAHKTCFKVDKCPTCQRKKALKT